MITKNIQDIPPSAQRTDGWHILWIIPVLIVVVMVTFVTEPFLRDDNETSWD